MICGIHNFYSVYNRHNALFNAEHYAIGENLHYPAVVLRKVFAQRGVALDTLDMHPIELFSKVIFLDFPTPDVDLLRELKHRGVEMYLIIWESEITKQDNWREENHQWFRKVFMWKSDVPHGERYVHLPLPNKLEAATPPHGEGKKLLVMIAGNKASNDPRELYSERMRAIRWFAKNHPDEFDLYGQGWDRWVLHRPFARLNRLPVPKYIHASHNPPVCYRGSLGRKSSTLSGYKFSIAYENACGLRGYITEKIFDCFNSRCIPIYLGAPDVDDYIPSNAFIHRDQFEGYDELYAYLENMSIAEYNRYLESIDRFLQSEAAKPFSAQYFAETIASIVLSS